MSEFKELDNEETREVVGGAGGDIIGTFHYKQNLSFDEINTLCNAINGLTNVSDDSKKEAIVKAKSCGGNFITLDGYFRSLTNQNNTWLKIYSLLLDLATVED